MAGRVFSNVREAIKEVERELFEMGLEVNGYSFQDQIHEGDTGMVTKELQAYDFTIIAPNPDEALQCVAEWYGADVLDWVWAEFKERVELPSVEGTNPGEAWKLRRGVWEQFLEESGKFSYTYAERMAPQIGLAVKELRQHPTTRQAIIEIHSNLHDLCYMGGKRRIPCSMFYQFMIRNWAIDCIYVMRSSDFLTHFVNDLALAVLLQDYMRVQVDSNFSQPLKQGNFTMFVSSLHAFAKDMEAKGIF